ncbi:hypothetical protein [Kitasatospora sp. NPDC004531]
MAWIRWAFDPGEPREKAPTGRHAPRPTGRAPRTAAGPDPRPPLDEKALTAAQEATAVLVREQVPETAQPLAFMVCLIQGA